MNTSFKTLQKGFIAMIAIAVLVACGGGDTDKKAELEMLKTEYSALGEKIKTLEAEIAATDTTQKFKIKDVYVTEVQPVVFRHFIDVQGAVDADESVDIPAAAMGKVKRVLVNEGDGVSAGQLLAEIDHDASTSQLNSMQPALDLAVEAYNRQKRLWDQKIGSEMQLLQAKSQKDMLEQQVKSLREQIDLSYIKSPISGSVDMVALKVGEVVAPGVPVIRVVNLSGLKVKGQIAESYASKVKKGNPVILHFPDINKDVESKITFTEKVIDPMTRSFTAEAALTGDNADYHPNMVSILKIIDYENPKALVLPVNTLQNVNDEHFVYIAVVEGNGTVAKKKVVQVGSIYNGQAEILSGLSANDKVVTTGQLDLVDGMHIRF